MVETFGVEKASRIPAFSGVPTLSKVNEHQASEEKEDISKFLYREAVGMFIWTAKMARLDIACTVRAVARFSVKTVD